MNTNKTKAEQLPQVAVMQSVLKASDLRIGNLIICVYLYWLGAEFAT